MMNLESNTFPNTMGGDLLPLPSLSGSFDFDAMSADSRHSGNPAFPWRLHAMLDAAEHQNYEDVVSWHSSGQAFKVHNPKVFVQKISPSYFNQTHYKSFQRQLNIYGFQRVTHGPNKGAYTHAFFVRGRPDKCQLMIRTRIKNVGAKAPGQRGHAPNRTPTFIIMDPVTQHPHPVRQQTHSINCFASAQNQREPSEIELLFQNIGIIDALRNKKKSYPMMQDQNVSSLRNPFSQNMYNGFNDGLYGCNGRDDPPAGGDDAMLCPLDPSHPSSTFVHTMGNRLDSNRNLGFEEMEGAIEFETAEELCRLFE